MIIFRQADKVVEKLQKQEKEIIAEEETAQQQEKQEQIVTIQELIEAVTKLQEVPDQARLGQIAEVLSMMDADADGVINVDHVLKVIELLGVEHTELPAKQVKQIIDVLSKEELLKVEENIEEILVKKPESEDSPLVDEAFERDLEALEKKAAADHKPKTS